MKLLLFLLVCAVGGYYGYEYLTEKSTHTGKPAPTLTPEAQLQALLSGKPVDATKVATLCKRFPSQAAEILKGRQIKVNGTIKVQGLWVRGIDSADMDIDLVGIPGKDVVFTTNYMRYNTEHTGRQAFDYKLVKVKGRLLLYSRGPTTTLERVIFTEREKVTLEGIVEVVGPGHVKIHYSEGVRVAKRSQNSSG